MNVNLTPELEMLVREAVRQMDEQDQMSAVRLEQLRQEVRKGLESGPSAAWDPDAMKQQARARRAGAKGSAKA